MSLFYAPWEIAPATSIPYAFMPTDLPGYPGPGFPVFIGVDMSSEMASRITAFISEAGYVDEGSLALTVELLTFSAASRGLLLTTVRVNFVGTATGGIEVKAATLPVPILLPGGRIGVAQVAAAAGVNAGMTVIAVVQVFAACRAARRIFGPKAWRRRQLARHDGGRGWPAFAEAGWCFVEVVHAFSQLAAVLVFWAGCIVVALSLEPLTPPFDVYENPMAVARPLLLRRAPLAETPNVAARGLLQASPAAAAGAPGAAAAAAGLAAPVSSFAASSVPASVTGPSDLLWADDGGAGILPPFWQRPEDSSGLLRVARAFQYAEGAARLSQAYWGLHSLTTVLTALLFFRALGFDGQFGFATNGVAFALPVR